MKSESEVGKTSYGALSEYPGVMETHAVPNAVKFNHRPR